MPTFEEIMKDRNKKSGVTKSFAKGQTIPPGLKKTGIIICPHCGKTIETLINIPNVPFQILTRKPGMPDTTIRNRKQFS